MARSSSSLRESGGSGLIIKLKYRPGRRWRAPIRTEYIATPTQVEYMLLPRLLAFSEVLWSPKEARSWPGFVARLPAQLTRLDAMGVRYRVPATAP